MRTPTKNKFWPSGALLLAVAIGLLGTYVFQQSACAQQKQQLPRKKGQAPVLPPTTLPPVPPLTAPGGAGKGELPMPMPMEKKDLSDVEKEIKKSIPPPVQGSPLAGLPVAPVDLPSALELGGAGNPQLLLARQRVLVAMVERQLAAAQLLPTLNAGTNYDFHTGNLQQSSGNILSVDRSALYAGAGVNAVVAGTVAVPGIVYNLNLSQTIFNILRSRQIVEQERFANAAARIEMTKRVALAYTGILWTEGMRSVARENRRDAYAVAELTAKYFKAGQGRKADADRAATEYTARTTDLVEAEGRVVAASAQLAQLLNLPPNRRLFPIENKVVPVSVVPGNVPVKELIGIALLNRPELAEKRAAIQAAMISLRNARMLPFSPNVMIGLSGGTFGGGSNLVASSRTPRFGAALNQPFFGNFGARNDWDVVSYWTLRNLGLGNRAMIREMASRLEQSRLKELAVFNRVRTEVVAAYVRAHTAFLQVRINERSMKVAKNAFLEDYLRIENVVKGALPIELLASFKLLAKSRQRYLDAIINFNQAQIRLYTALGQPPAAVFARPGDEPPVLVKEKK